VGPRASLDAVAEKKSNEVIVVPNTSTAFDQVPRFINVSSEKQDN
jgi:hypothetical protein